MTPQAATKMASEGIKTAAKQKLVAALQTKR